VGFGAALTVMGNVDALETGSLRRGSTRGEEISRDEVATLRIAA